MNKLFSAVIALVVKRTKLSNKIVKVCLMLAGLFCTSAYAQTESELTRGLLWLQAQVSADGTILGESISNATSAQTRSEVALAISELAGISAVSDAQRAKLTLKSNESVEYLARNIIALGSVGADVNSLMVELNTRQNGDGGFGSIAGDSSSALDTVWAYSALSRGPTFAGANAARAYILLMQAMDGGMAGDNLGQRVQNSALAILALRVTGSDLLALNASRQLVSWLQAKQQTDGSWNGSPYLTAVALNALSSQGADSTVRANARAYLLAQQAVDGSWGADPFLTAIALRAIAIDPMTTPAASSITGIAMDPFSGLPISGAQVSLTGAASNATTTGSEGRFTFIGLSSGSYTVGLMKTGFSSSTRQATLGYGQSLDLGIIGMGQDSTAGIVRGKVSSATSGLGVAGASVALSGTVAASTTTDVQGSYEFAGVPAGALSITIAKTGLVSATAAGNLAAGQTLNFSPTLYDTGAPGVVDTGRLVGKIVSAGTGAAFSGAVIELNGVNAGVSASDGSFDIPALTPQSYILRIAPSGYDAVVGNFLLAAGSVIDAGTIALSAQRSSTEISGRVTDQLTGQAVSGAQITPIGGTSVVSGLDGRFVLMNLSGTVFDLRVAASGYLTQTLQIQVDRPSQIVQDFAIEPQPVSAIDLHNLIVAPANVTSLSSVGMSAIVINNGGTAQSIALTLQVLNQNGNVVATGSAFTVDGVNLLGSFDLGAQEERPVIFKWNSGQFAPGTYRLVGSVVEAGSISRESPVGRVLAMRSANLIITPSIQIIGSVTADPPILRANTGTSVKLSALVQNNGNVEAHAQTYQLSVIDEATSAVVTSSEQTLGVLQPNQIEPLAFPDWVPTNGGNFRLEVAVPGVPEIGKLTGKVYVGDAANASYTVNKSVVPVGNQVVHATLLVTGQDSASGTVSDPLAVPIKAAIQKGVTYNDLQASNWALTNKCLGCHVVSQALVGGELTRRLTTFNSTQRNTLINSLTSYVQSNGAVYASHPEFAVTQTMLGLWALNSWRSKDDFAASLAKVADYIVGRQEGAGSWSADHASGWWDARPANTAFNLKSLTEVIDTLRRVPNPSSYSRQAWKSGGGLNGAYYLGKTPSGQVLVSNYAAGTVMAINSDGTTQTLVSGVANPQGIVQTADGDLYIVAAAGIYKRSTSGTTTFLAAKPPGATLAGITVGPDGYLYVSAHGTNSIYRVSPLGTLTTYFSGNPLNGPIGMTFDASANLIVTNYSGSSVVRIKPDKSYARLVSWTNGNPRSVVPYGDGWLVGTTTGTYRYNSDWIGERLSFSASDGLVALPDNTIVTSDGGSTVAKLLPVAIDGSAKIASYSNAISKANTWLMNDANVNTLNNLQLAHRLIGLGSAKSFYKGLLLADTIQTKMDQVGLLLRSRQRSDGGWGVWNTSASDSLVTAQVGFALDYLQPAASDPVVQKAIKFLLARQLPDGSWPSENGVLTTHLAATTWVEIWLPIALDRIGGIDADVTLRFAPSVSLSNASPAPTTIVNNPDGSVTRKWQMTGVTTASRTIEFDLGLADMQLDETRAVSEEAYLTFRNSFNSDSVNAPIKIPAVSASAFLGLGLTTDRTEYDVNTPVAITAQIANLGAAAADGSVEFWIYAFNGVPVMNVGRVPFTALGIGASGAIAAVWNTGTAYAGQYYVEGKLYDSENRYVATARSAFAIRASAAIGAVTLSGQIKTDKLVYAPTEGVRLTDRITNLALNQSASGLKVETSIVNPDGSLRWNVTASLFELVAATQRDVGYFVALNMAPPGSYIARLVVRDESGAVVAADSNLFTVQSSALTGAGLVGTIQAMPKQVPLGDAVTMNFDVTNHGNAALANLPLTVNVVDPVAQQVVATFPTVIDVNQGATYAATASWTAAGAVGNNYVAVLSANIGGGTLVLAQDTLNVIEPPVKFALNPGVRKDARLLVLVSCQPGANANGGTASEDLSCVTSRAQWLASFLSEQGILHHISTTVEDFVRELHCGRYNSYWLSGGVNKLGATAAKEVREAVYRGAGLIIDGTHDERNGLLDEIPGVIYRGKLPQSGYEVQLAAPVFSQATLTSSGTALKYDLAGGVSQAIFSAVPDVPSVVTRTFGTGSAALFAFDLVESLQAGGWTDVFRSGLTSVVPQQSPVYVGGAWVPLTLSLTNQAQPSVVVVTAALPIGVNLDGVPPGASLDAAGNPVWQFTLAANETREILMAVRAPYVSGPVSIPLQVSTIRNGVTKLYGDISVDFTVQAADSSGVNLVTAIQALAPTTSPQRNARDRAVVDVQGGLTLMAQGKPADALLKFLAAADELDSISTVSVIATRTGLAALIAESEAHQCSRLPICAAAAPRVVSDGLFTAFAPNEGLQAQGGASGDADWEWGMGPNTTAIGSFVAADHAWVSARQYGWTLGIDVAGNASLSVLDGASTVLNLNFGATSSSRLRIGNALQIGVRSTSAAGLAKVDATVTSLQGQAVSGAQGTRGDGTYSEGQITYLLPSGVGPVSASGTVRLTFPDPAPPPGSTLNFTVNAGNTQCQ